eukprot:gene40050-49523_t
MLLKNNLYIDASAASPNYQNNFYSQDEATRKARYDDFVKEQAKRADSDRRAKEFAENLKQAHSQANAQYAQ